ncbi:MAG TPA: ATP synthase F1 subunit epsilon [Solirubrobacterales bacterium]|nr:ATP synthase F1 subunit epsilon [Solirubrobacterales bacterium]
MADGPTFEVEVLTPEGEVFEGEVRQVSTRTAVGEIGILANHAPLLAALRPTELRLQVSDSETRRYAQAHGWLQVFGNRARLLVEEAIDPEQLDAATLKEQLADAEQRLAEAEEGSAARGRAEKDRIRAEAFLAIAQG